MPDIYVAGGAGPTLAPSTGLRATEGQPPSAKATEGQGWWREVIDKVLRESGESPRRVLWGAYHVRPRERFVTQQQDEEIVLLLRDHPIVNLKWIIIALLMVAAGWWMPLGEVFVGLAGRYVLMGRVVIVLLAWVYALEQFLHWYYSIFLVTNERIIDVDFYNLMWRVVTHINLNHIEEPVMGQRGFGATFFRYGYVLVQTAGTQEATVEARAAPHPHKVVEIISRLSEELEKRRERGE